MYPIFINTLENSAPLFLTLGIVLWFRYLGIFSKTLKDPLGVLIFKLVLPIFCFQIVYEMSFSREDLPILSALLIIHLLTLPLIFLSNSVFKLNKKILGTLLLLPLSYSVGPIAYPFVQLNFEKKVFNKLVSIDILLFVGLMICGPVIASIFDQKNKTEYRKIFLSVLTAPLLIMVFLAGFLNLTNFVIPNGFINFFEFVSSSFVFLVSIFVGLSLITPNFKRLKLLTYTFGIRLIFAIAVSVFVIYLFQPSREMSLAIPLTLFMGFSSMPIVYTDQYNLDSDLMAQLSIFSRAGILILYPFLITFLKSIY